MGGIFFASYLRARYFNLHTNQPRNSKMLSTVPDVIFKTRVRDESIGGKTRFAGRMSAPMKSLKGKKL